MTSEVSLDMSLQIHSDKLSDYMCLFDRILSKGKRKPKCRANFVTSGFPPHVLMSGYSSVKYSYIVIICSCLFISGVIVVPS